MRNPLTIGDKVFKYKKDALAYYKNILNFYKFGESLSDEHYTELLNLLEYDYLLNENKVENEVIATEEENTNDETKVNLEIIDIRVAKAQFNTKCFEVVYDDNSSWYISYLLIINRPKHNSEKIFNVACRNTIQNDMRTVKLEYFKSHSVKGEMRCQETGKLSKWEDLVVDHRQPNMFSIIVDRFKEINQINTDEVEYHANDDNRVLFDDQNLSQDLLNYHKQKANLRVVRKESNLSRTGMARIKKTAKDLTIK